MVRKSVPRSLTERETCCPVRTPQSDAGRILLVTESAPMIVIDSFVQDPVIGPAMSNSTKSILICSTVGVALYMAHLYIVSVPDTSTFVTLVDEADVVVVVVGKSILGACLVLAVPDDEEQDPVVAVLTSSG